MSEHKAFEIRAGYCIVGLDDVGDVDIKFELGDDALFKVVLTPDEAQKLAAALR